VVLFALQFIQSVLEVPELEEPFVGYSGGQVGGADKGQNVALLKVAPADDLNVVAGTDNLKGAVLGVQADIGGRMVKHEGKKGKNGVLA
jgi:hypothetical protein